MTINHEDYNPDLKYGAKQSESKLAIANGKLVVGDSDGVGAEVNMSGDATMDNAGAVTISALAVDNAMMSVPKLVTYQETFAFGDMTDSTTTGTLALSTTIPKGAIFVQSFIDAVTGFAGDTSAAITIGDGSDVDRYNTATPDVFSTVDHLSAGAPSGTAFHSADKTPTVVITTAADFTSVTAGSATITLMYYQSV